jgi:hypothetical protein
MTEHSSTVETVTNGVVGVMGTAAGWVAYLNVADELLKFVSLLIGTLVAAISLYRLIRNKKRR